MNQEENLLQNDAETAEKNSTENLAEDAANTDNNEQKIAALEQEIAELKDKQLRLLSEFENYKRRSAKERIDLLKTASKDIIIDLLPVLDDFERGLETMQKSDDVNSIREGVLLIHAKFLKLLTAKGLNPMETIGQPFDTDLHEAVSQIPAPTEEQKHTILHEAEKGYRLNDHVIRYAKVIVGV